MHLGLQMQASRRLARAVNKHLVSRKHGFVSLAAQTYIYLLDRLKPVDSSLLAKELILEHVVRVVEMHACSHRSTLACSLCQSPFSALSNSIHFPKKSGGQQRLPDGLPLEAFLVDMLECSLFKLHLATAKSAPKACRTRLLSNIPYPLLQSGLDESSVGGGVQCSRSPRFLLERLVLIIYCSASHQHISRHEYLNRITQFMKADQAELPCRLWQGISS